MCSISILIPAALFKHYTTCCLICDLWYVHLTRRNHSVSGQVTQVAIPLVHHFLPYFLNNFCSNLHSLTAKMGRHTSMSHPHLFSCCMRDILQQSSKVQAWTLGSLNLFSSIICIINCTGPAKISKISYISHEYTFMLSNQCPNYAFIPSINSLVANVLRSCNWISG